MGHRLTASGLDRAAACPGSGALTQHPHSDADTAWGNVAHHYLDRVAKVGHAAALGEIDDPEEQARCAAIDLDAIPAGSESEVAFAYDPESDTAERVAVDKPRGYVEDGRIWGTADRVGVRDGAIYVGDFKTGNMQVRAAQSRQLGMLALAASRVAGLHSANVAMPYLRHDGSWFTDHAHLDALDLDATRADLLNIQADARAADRVVARGGLPQLVPGIQCVHCAAASECPALERQSTALVAVAEAPTDLVTWFGDLDEERAGALAEQAIVVAKVADKLRDAANARVRATGALALPSGRVLRVIDVKAQVQSQRAKERIAALKNTLREEGEISQGQTTQVRVTGPKKP